MNYFSRLLSAILGRRFIDHEEFNKDFDHNLVATLLHRANSTDDQELLTILTNYITNRGEWRLANPKVAFHNKKALLKFIGNLLRD